MTNGWMVRAGENGRLFEDFEKGYVAIGWGDIEDMTALNTREKMNAAHEEKYSHHKPGRKHNAAAMAHKFRNELSKGDFVLTYNPASREYLIGEITGDYEYRPDAVGDYGNIRKANWTGKISRDSLKSKTRNSLGSTLTLFSLNEDVIADLKNALNGRSAAVETPDETEEAQAESRDEVINQSKEFIKDRITSLDPDQMEILVAKIFKAMGFRSRVSPKGPDRGVDVFASPDGLGLQEPRIKAEVKHQSGTIGAPVLRGFIGALRSGDKGVYISTGGFTREARYEADRANVPVTLVDIDELAMLVVDNYEDFDSEAKALVPLVKLYWPLD
jgi:restriction system protein